MADQGYFITGTDTGVGKTWVTVALMQMFKRQGLNVTGMKPVAAGCEWRQGQWMNGDALLIQENSSLSLSYRQINPYAYELPVSPHLASREGDVDRTLLLQVFGDLKDQADIVMVEGAGGWLSPLDNSMDNAKLAELLGLPTIIVVGIRLGCINQGLLTWRAVEASGLNCRGWVATIVDRDMQFVDENIAYLKKRIRAPLLGVLPYQEHADFEELSHLFSGF